MNSIKRKLQRRKARFGVSEVIGSVLLMGITLAVGFAVWAWASSAAIASEKSFGNSVNSNATCLTMTYTGVNANFSTASSSLVTVWFYNNGQGDINIRSVIISNTSWTYSYTLSPTSLLLVQNVNSITVNIGTSFTKDSLYTFKSTGSNTTTIVEGNSAIQYGCGIVSASYQQVTPDTSPV